MQKNGPNVPLPPPPAGRSGFALAELMVSVVLVAVISISVGLAVYRAQQRTGAAKTSLTQVQLRNDIVRTIAEELRWATQVSLLTDRSVTFSCPNIAAAGMPETITYTWDIFNRRVLRSRNGSFPQAVADDIYLLRLDSDTLPGQPHPYLRGLTLTIQFGPDAANTVQRYVECFNTPTLQDASPPQDHE